MLAAVGRLVTSCHRLVDTTVVRHVLVMAVHMAWAVWTFVVARPWGVRCFVDGCVAQDERSPLPPYHTMWSGLPLVLQFLGAGSSGTFGRVSAREVDLADDGDVVV